VDAERGGGRRRGVVALGANLGDRVATLRAAVRDLDAVDGVSVVAGSRPVESVALTLDGPDASRPGYVNAVVLVETTLDAAALLEALHAVEAQHGRVRTERWGDRTLDLDLVDLEGVRVDGDTGGHDAGTHDAGTHDAGTDEVGLDEAGGDEAGAGGTAGAASRLRLPHPRAAERDFVLAPWLEVDPAARLTGQGTVADLLAALPTGSGPLRPMPGEAPLAAPADPRGAP